MLVTVAAVTGCRRGELAALKWCDYQEDVLHIRGSAYNVGRVKGVKTTKTGRRRRVAVHQRLAEVLESWRASRAEEAAAMRLPYGPEGFVFSETPGATAPININTVSTRLPCGLVFTRFASTPFATSPPRS
jgi:integrase